MNYNLLRHYEKLVNKKIYIYLRISNNTTKSLEYLKFQEVEITKFLEQAKIKAKQSFLDILPLNTNYANRPELQKLLSKLKTGDIVLTYSLDSIFTAKTSDGIDLLEKLAKKHNTVGIIRDGIDTLSMFFTFSIQVCLSSAEFQKRLREEYNDQESLFICDTNCEKCHKVLPKICNECLSESTTIKSIVINKQ